ncbi:MAG: endonuclease/exonuclease/phosphatase family protein [Clostridia bacterium]|nr:endonuclease/exonuclease/phosphatase family protein [Clostridia bacterium]
MNGLISSAASLRFASYNILHGKCADEAMSGIAKNIIENEIDIVGIQEIDRGTQRSDGRDILRVLSEATGYKHYVFFKTISFDGGDYGIGVLSRYPIIADAELMLDSEGGENRALGYAQIDVNGKAVSFFVTHLSFDSPTARKKQMAQISKTLKNYNDFVLAGDFNTSDFSIYEAISGYATLNKKESPAVTFPDGELSIDNIVYSADAWSFGEINVVTDSYSDHYMIWGEAIRKSYN